MQSHLLIQSHIMAPIRIHLADARSRPGGGRGAVWHGGTRAHAGGGEPHGSAVPAHESAGG
eukprot:scaffold245169_cov21-Tisochrysis_lutea.AAC.1